MEVCEYLGQVFPAVVEELDCYFRDNLTYSLYSEEDNSLEFFFVDTYTGTIMLKKSLEETTITEFKAGLCYYPFVHFMFSLQVTPSFWKVLNT